MSITCVSFPPQDLPRRQHQQQHLRLRLLRHPQQHQSRRLLLHLERHRGRVQLLIPVRVPDFRSQGTGESRNRRRNKADAVSPCPHVHLSKIASISNGVRKAVAGRAGNYRFATANPSRGGLAACAPQNFRDIFHRIVTLLLLSRQRNDAAAAHSKTLQPFNVANYAKGRSQSTRQIEKDSRVFAGFIPSSFVLIRVDSWLG
jgi:hypothetical protein